MTDILDFPTIASRVAALWSSITPPTGYARITKSTHLLPNTIKTPAMLVKPPIWAGDYGPGQARGELTFPCEFYLIEGADLASNAAKIYAWMSPLFSAPVANYNLGPTGISGVIDVTITGGREGVLTYSGKNYIGIQWEVRVRIVAAYNAVGT